MSKELEALEILNKAAIDRERRDMAYKFYDCSKKHLEKALTPTTEQELADTKKELADIKGKVREFIKTPYSDLRYGTGIGFVRTKKSTELEQDLQVLCEVKENV